MKISENVTVKLSMYHDFLFGYVPVGNLDANFEVIEGDARAPVISGWKKVNYEKTMLRGMFVEPRGLKKCFEKYFRVAILPERSIFWMGMFRCKKE